MARGFLKRELRRLKKRFWNWPLYGLYRLLKGVLRRLSPARKARLAHRLGQLAYRLDRRHRLVIRRNLAFYLGDRLDENRREAITRQLYERFLRYLFDVIEHDYRTKEQLGALVRVEDDTPLKSALERGDRVIILAAHYGHWELIGQYLCAFYRPFVGIAQRFSQSEKLTQELQDYRHRAGMEILPRKGAMRKIAQSLKAGKMVGFLPDQATRHGKPVLFFSHSGMDNQMAVFPVDGNKIPGFG